MGSPLGDNGVKVHDIVDNMNNTIVNVNESQETAPTDAAPFLISTKFDSAATLTDNVELEDIVTDSKPKTTPDTNDPITISSAGIGSTTANPEETAKWWTRPTLSWLTPFMKIAVKRPVQFSDLFRLHPKFEAKGSTNRMENWIKRAVEKVMADDKTNGKYVDVKDMSDVEKQAYLKRKTEAIKNALFWGSFWSFPREFTMSFFLHGLSSLGNLASPILLSFFLRYIVDPTPTYLGYVYCVLILIAQTCVAFG
ncbi:hypothetical protein HDU76_011774, partial [Blyttiomyces sp. JEL0837]